MYNFYIRNRRHFLSGIVVVSAAVLLLLATTAPSPLIEASPIPEYGTAMPGPTPEEQPDIVESENAFPWPPSNLPTTGNPQIKVVELQTKPTTFNSVNLIDAPWIRSAVNSPGHYVGMDQVSVAQFFAYYEQAKNHNAYFEVTFPNGFAKYFEVIYTEVP